MGRWLHTHCYVGWLTSGPDQVATSISILAQWFEFLVATGRLHHNARCYFGSLQAGPVIVAMIRRRHLPVANINIKHSRLWNEVFRVFFKTFHHDRKLKRQTVEDKIIPTLIDLNRVGIVVSSTVDSCWLQTVRIFNIINLHFRERGGTKLATLCCFVGSLTSGPGLTSNGQMLTLACCYCDPH
jgi:hypothetical protein